MCVDNDLLFICSLCLDLPVVDEQTCDTLAVETIPPCMVKEGTAAKEYCMQMVCTLLHLF